MKRFTLLHLLLLTSFAAIACGDATSGSHSAPDGSAAAAGATTAGGGTTGIGGASSGGAATGGGMHGGGLGAAGGSGGGAGGAGGHVAGTGGAAPGSGGTVGSGGAQQCSPVSFHLSIEGLQPGTQLCSGPAVGCSADWLSITDARGAPVNGGLSGGLYCTVDCASCGMRLCPPLPCIFPQLLRASGQDEMWGGGVTLGGTCGTGKSCYTAGCAAPGRYVAHMCGYPLSVADGSVADCHNASSTAKCVDVPFDYPTSQTVNGVLRP